MLGANAYIPVRDYSVANVPPEKPLEPRVVKLSRGTFTIGKKTFLKSENFAVAKKEKASVVKKMNFAELSAKEKQDIEKKAARLGKVISFSDKEIRSALAGERKVAKLGEPFIGKVNGNGLLCSQVISKQKAVEIPKQVVNVPVKEKEDENVVIHFDPEQIKQKVNRSFENVAKAEERIEFTPIKEYTIDIPTEEEEEVSRLPHADRSVRFDMAEEKENDSIHFSTTENDDVKPINRMPVLSIDEMLRHDGLLDGSEVNMEESIQEDEGIALLAREVVEAQRFVDGVARDLENARMEKETNASELEKTSALAKSIEEEREKACKEREQVERQKEETRKAHEATLDATRKKLEAEKMRIMNRAKAYQKEYQKVTEESNRLWSERVSTEERIDVIETEIPAIKSQIETEREAIASLRKRTKQIREMANDVTSTDNVAENISSSMEKNFFEESAATTNSSIFEGTTPIDFSNRKVISFSKGKKAA